MAATHGELLPAPFEAKLIYLKEYGRPHASLDG